MIKKIIKNILFYTVTLTLIPGIILGFILYTLYSICFGIDDKTSKKITLLKTALENIRKEIKLENDNI